MHYLFIKRIRKPASCLLTALLSITIPVTYAATQMLHWNTPQLAPLQEYFTQTKLPRTVWPKIQCIPQSDLPEPYDFLLTQPVMTLGLTQHYQRTPKLRTPLYIIENTLQKTYARGIVMIIDNNAQRNDASTADHLQQSTIVELGLITMNFNALPAKVIEQIKHSRIPFGALLAKNNIKTHDGPRYFFKISCDKTLVVNLHCTLGQTLYGRTNTLINEQAIWVAHVVEILTGAPTQEHGKEKLNSV